MILMKIFTNIILCRNNKQILEIMLQMEDHNKSLNKKISNQTRRRSEESHKESVKI